MFTNVFHEPSLVYNRDESYHSHREPYLGCIEVESICIELCRHRLYSGESESRSEGEDQENDHGMRKVEICELYPDSLCMLFRFFEEEIDREDIDGNHYETENDNRGNTCDS